MSKTLYNSKKQANRRTQSTIKFDSIEHILTQSPPTQLPFSLHTQERIQLREDIVRQVLAVLHKVVSRQCENYPFIDTKFNLITGEDFYHDDPLRGKSVIYSWIQGRGLEAVASHGQWLREEALVNEGLRKNLLDSINRLLPRVIAAMENIRAANQGFMPFMTNTQGQQLQVSEDGKTTPIISSSTQHSRSLADLFYAKGLIAAGHYLGNKDLKNTAEELFAEIISALQTGNFVFGQVALDPKNPVQPIPGRFSHAGHMIAIGASTLFYNLTGKREYSRIGCELINYILDNHTLTGEHTNRFTSTVPELRKGDLWEFNDKSGLPWHTEQGQVWSDSGHATEFVGLSLAHLHAINSNTQQTTERLSDVLFRNFANGFKGPGITKAFDLISRQPINDDMPWWSLPETMRAAALVARLPQSEGADCILAQAIFTQSWNGFCQGYLRPQQGFTAVQCIQSDGAISTAIPATPDADPCYHTGLSLIACLPWLETRPTIS